MQIETTNIAGVLVLKLDTFGDDRGLFVETFAAAQMAEAGINDIFSQDALTVSTAKHTMRGLHFQRPPFAQSKLVRCEQGAFFDVAVDLREASSTFGQHFSIELTDHSWNMVYLPVGIAHGICTLIEETRVSYKIAGTYAPDHAAGLNWQDPRLNISWPIAPADAIISDRDQALPDFDPATKYFA